MFKFDGILCLVICIYTNTFSDYLHVYSMTYAMESILPLPFRTLRIYCCFVEVYDLVLYNMEVPLDRFYFKYIIDLCPDSSNVLLTVHLKIVCTYLFTHKVTR